jgi:type IV pilus assembly protein PilW
MRLTPSGRQRGLSLIELMISMAIGLFLLAGLVGIFVNSSQTNAELFKAAQQIENGRFAMQIIGDDLALAGYQGYYAAPAAAATPNNPCVTDAPTLFSDMAMPVQGYNAPASPPAPLSGCLPPANHLPGTDILVIRRADSQATAGNTFQIGRVYIQHNGNQDDNPVVKAATAATGTLGAGNTFPLMRKDTVTPAPVRKVHVHIYFVSPCSVPTGGGSTCTGASDDNGNPIPTLKRLELIAGAWQTVPIAEGIENLQYDYGVDADSDGSPETPFVQNPATAPDWSNVVAVHVNLLARNVEASPGYTDAKTYNLGQFVSVTPIGAATSYKRHAYTAQVRIVNVSARRETP